MNLLWEKDAATPDQRNMIATASRRCGKLDRQRMLIKTIAAMGGGTPARGMAFAVNLELVLWKPSGEVATVGKDGHNGDARK